MIRRTRSLQQEVKPKPQTQEPAQRIRPRARPRPALESATLTPEELYAKASPLLQSIAKLDERFAEIASERDGIEKRLVELLKKADQEQVDNGVYQATYKASEGKSTRPEIDLKVLRKKLPDERAFLSVLSVSLTKLKEVMTEKEINMIAPLEPGKPGEPKLTLKRIKK